MWRLIALAVALCAFHGSETPAQTQVTQSKRFVLPDGVKGEMHLLVSDGVLTDMPRLVLVGQDGRVLARSGRARSLTTICDWLRPTCVGYDRGTFEILKPNPPDFRSDGLILDGALASDEGDPRWAWRRLEGDWGFSRRPAPLRTIATALLEEAAQLPTSPAFAVVTLASAVAAFLALMKPTQAPRWRVLVSMVQSVASAGLIVLVALVSTLAYSHFGASIPLIAAGILAGCALSAGALRLWRRLIPGTTTQTPRA